MIENLLQQMSKEKLNKLLCQGPERGNFGFSVNLRTKLYFVRTVQKLTCFSQSYYYCLSIKTKQSKRV